MRFDDKLTTVLARSLNDASARAAAWRQLIDLLAQSGDVPGADAALAMLRHLRDDVPVAVRADAVRAIAGRSLSAAIVAFIAEEPPTVSSAVLGSATLPDAAWIELLPRLTPTARSLLRHRRDLSGSVRQALDSFGGSDFVIAASSPDVQVLVEEVAASEPAVDAVLSDGETQIRELLARIAAFREGGHHAPRTDDPAEPADASAEIDDFRFETGPDGLIRWVKGAPRGPLIGITIATAAEQYGHGVDGHAAGAFRRRASFRDARLSIAGEGAAGGEWRISGVPFFDHHDGRFTGYRGTARRPRADENAPHAGAGGGLYGSGLSPDSLRQLVHELRTPLNAIVGFAEMIERQMLGPAAIDYRERAADIVEQGRRLLATVDDLDVAARLETRRAPDVAGTVDGAMLLARLHGEYETLAAERGVKLAFRISPALPAIDADPVAVERMFARLLAATIGLAEGGETIAATLDADGGEVRLAVSRPNLLAQRDERALLDPGYSPEGDWPDAPVLGLGFALRLIRNLAASARGRLDIAPTMFELHLPARDGALRSGNGNG